MPRLSLPQSGESRIRAPFKGVGPAFILSALIAAPALAADITLDDFTTGHFRSPQYKSGWGVHAPEQSGSMIGGYRDTYMDMCDPKVAGDCATRDPYGVTASYFIGQTKDKSRSAFVMNAGYEAVPRVEILYGQGPGGMNADLSGGPDRRLRVTFESLSQGLNFNIELLTGIGRGLDGCNLLASNQPFVLEMPLSEFQMANGGFDASSITLADVIFQAGDVVGAVEFGLTRIEVVDQALDGAIHCGPIGS